MWGHFMDGVLKACDVVCGKKRGNGSKGDTWWLLLLARLINFQDVVFCGFGRRSP